MNEEEETFDPETFMDHFKNLNSAALNLTEEQLQISREVEILENDQVFNELDYRVSESEVLSAIKQLKLDKSAGLDCILNEMIKAGQCGLLHPILKLFNLILSTGNYPTEWSLGKIIPLHKKGSRDDPSNCTGITISSCLGKLFNSILNARLTSFLDKNDLLAKEQIGFRKKHRTSDHMFIVKTIMDKYKRSRKQLFLCFVDFRKAFDTVWHVGLLYKLLKLGMPNKFYGVIKNMYQNVLLAVQCKSNHLTPSFPSYVGVRQGDNLSPTLFNIFVNDIPSLFEDCAPPSVGQMTIPCLLYADDLLILSENESGLNNALSRLNRYCETWGLEVNTTKTKYMCLNPDKKSPSPKISFSSTVIECVQSFTYLGIEFSSDGAFNIAKKLLYKKALKVYFKISKTLRPSPQVDTMLHLFDHLMKPILMYGSEIWGVSNLNFKMAFPKPGDLKSQF